MGFPQPEYMKKGSEAARARLEQMTRQAPLSSELSCLLSWKATNRHMQTSIGSLLLALTKQMSSVH